MPGIFLSHTHIDKPFVEKLAGRLNKLGVKTWFDKWEIKVGESITWKIEEGIKTNEFLGIVLSPEALKSEWVKSELDAAWFKQMETKKIVVLPIYHRDCEIPLLLRARKYADFRTGFEDGLSVLAGALGIKDTAIISMENWRRFAGKDPKWKYYRDEEFKSLVTKLTDLAIEYNWSTYVGGSALPFSMVFSNNYHDKEYVFHGIRLDGKRKAYLFTDKAEHNPNHMKAPDFDQYVGNSVNSCEEFIWRIFENYKMKHGNPTGQSRHFNSRFVPMQEQTEIIQGMTNKLRWYQGDKI